MAKSKSKKRKEKRQYSDARKRVEMRGSGFERTTIKVPDGTKFFQFKKEGLYYLEILPYTAGEGNPYADEGITHYERTYYVHPRLGPDENSYVCPAKTYGKKCPVCQERERMKKRGVDKETLKDLDPKERQMFWVYDTKDPESGIQLLEMSYHLFGKQLDKQIRDADEDEDYPNFFHTDTGGYTLKLGVEEKSFNNNSFFSVETVNFKPRKKDLADVIEGLEDVACLDDFIIETPYDKLKKIFMDGEDEEEDEDEDEDEPRSKKKSKASSKKKSKPVDDDEDEDEDEDDEDVDDDEDEDEDEDEDDEPAPKKKSKASSKKSKKPSKDEDEDDDEDDEDEDEDDEDEDEDDDDEEPAPKKSKSSSKSKSSKSKKKSSDDDDEDWDDDDEDWDDEEPAPKKKSKKKR